MASCSAINCKATRYFAKKNKEKIIFYSFPPLIRNAKTLIDKLKSKRCKAWLKAINRVDLKDSPYTQTKIKKATICGFHFISGKPSDVFDISNKDWIPTLNLGYEPKLNYLESLRPKSIHIPNVSGYNSQLKFYSENMNIEKNQLHESIKQNESYCDISGSNNENGSVLSDNYLPVASTSTTHKILTNNTDFSRNNVDDGSIENRNIYAENRNISAENRSVSPDNFYQQVDSNSTTQNNILTNNIDSSRNNVDDGSADNILQHVVAEAEDVTDIFKAVQYHDSEYDGGWNILHEEKNDEDSQKDADRCHIVGTESDVIMKDLTNENELHPTSANTHHVTQQCDVSTETDISISYIDRIEDELRIALIKITTLETNIDKLKWNADLFKNSDQRARFFTGLPTLSVYNALFDAFQIYLPNANNFKLSQSEMLQMTLMKLRLGMSFTHLAFQYNVSIPTASSCFYKCLYVLYTKLRSLVKWPSREELRKTMPPAFRAALGHSKLATIIDCFEVAIEYPSRTLASSQCWSSYKHSETIKILIGSSPQGSVNFISSAYGGRCSDKFVTEDSGLLNLLLPGDVILADRGFTLKVEIALQQATLITPTFVKGVRQLDPRDVEFTRRIASVRIHVERVIGLIRQKYLILTNKLPMSIISKITYNIPVIDQIVTVCAALVNLCPSVIPQNENEI